MTMPGIRGAAAHVSAPNAHLYFRAQAVVETNTQTKHAHSNIFFDFLQVMRYIIHTDQFS
jgi:hypothetical protein